MCLLTLSHGLGLYTLLLLVREGSMVEAHLSLCVYTYVCIASKPVCCCREVRR